MNAGLSDWVAADEEEYVAKAVLFASDIDKLASLRAGLRSQVLASPLFDAPRFARNIEQALWDMWNQWDPSSTPKEMRKLPKESTQNKSVEAETSNPPQDQITALVNLYNSGQTTETEQACRELLQSYPRSPVVANILGASLISQGKLQEAVASFDKAIQFSPDYAETYCNRGIAFEAAASCNQAIQLKPGFAEPYNNRGNVLEKLGQLDEAMRDYDKAIQLKPDYVKAYNNRSIVLEQLGQLDEALINCNKAIQLKPDYASAYCIRGIVLEQLGQLEEAVESYDKAIQLKPDYAEAYSNRGGALKDLGLLDEALTSYDQAIQLEPDYAKSYSNLLMTLNYTPDLDLNNHIERTRKFGELVTAKAGLRFSDYQCQPTPEKLRVGLVSGDLRNHPIGYFLESVLSSIDPSKIELIAYPTTPTVDDLSERIKPSFSMWKPIFGQTDEAAAKLIYADGVHVLLDLSGHTAGNRLLMFGHKPSPVQVSWLGYFATTGLNEMDYLIGDPYVTPPKDDEQFTEEVWRLPETRWCFTPPDIDVEVSEPPAVNHGYVTFGCFNNTTKVNDKVVALWAKVLDAVPNSRLLLKAKQLRDQMTRENIIQRFAAHGIDNKQIILEESEDRQKYFAAYNKIDITLDPFPFTGGTTSVESLWMGVPLVTLAGGSLISRQGVGVLMNTGLSDWVAADEEEYVAKAVLFASDIDKLASLRAGLRSQVLASPLFDAPRFARNIEQALWDMWNQWDPSSTPKEMRKLPKESTQNKSVEAETSNPPQDQITALVNLYNSGQTTETEQACRELLQSYPRSLVVHPCI